jgi:hypothetical protein
MYTGSYQHSLKEIISIFVFEDEATVFIKKGPTKSRTRFNFPHLNGEISWHIVVLVGRRVAALAPAGDGWVHFGDQHLLILLI